ncbi:uncharacterized protein HaLaN_26786 [Haematococcus lacustris]|uniref:Uncharacterized protein n=1 Tax=Haematococcus lacustris TaxID=44745 RepID=A0A6A0A754_HAELA|nr:uncharacterized protein HaLaN_26786 [Haematococcus lacustris]
MDLDMLLDLQGEQAAVLATLDALTTCLERTEGCKVVPGLAEDLATSTVALSVAGGLVAGAVTLIEPAGFVKARWQWLIQLPPTYSKLYSIQQPPATLENDGGVHRVILATK